MSELTKVKSVCYIVSNKERNDGWVFIDGDDENPEFKVNSNGKEWHVIRLGDKNGYGLGPWDDDYDDVKCSGAVIRMTDKGFITKLPPQEGGVHRNRISNEEMLGIVDEIIGVQTEWLEANLLVVTDE